MWKWTKRILITIGILILALRFADRISRRASPLPPIPQPNGYETILAIASEVRVPQGDLIDLGSDAIRQLAETNQPALARLHEALRSDTGVPLGADRGWVDKHAEHVKKLKRLAVVLGTQSKAEILNGNTNGSAKCFLDVILLGQALARGGILSDGINAIAVETVGTTTLRLQVSSLDAAFCRSAAQELERAEARRELPERIVQTEKDWAAMNFGLVGRVGDLLLRRPGAQRHAQFTGRYQEMMKRTRRLMLILAARAVELETGKRVANPSNLVPGVLQSLPLDPEKKTPMTDILVEANERREP